VRDETVRDTGAGDEEDEIEERRRWLTNGPTFKGKIVIAHVYRTHRYVSKWMEWRGGAKKLR
jgi:hypothetical protein